MWVSARRVLVCGWFVVCALSETAIRHVWWGGQQKLDAWIVASDLRIFGWVLGLVVAAATQKLLWASQMT